MPVTPLQPHPLPVGSSIERDFFLRPLHMSDSDMYFENFDRNREHIAGCDAQMAETSLSVLMVRNELAPYNYRSFPHFAIMRKAEMIGSTALRNGLNRQSEISWWLDQRFTGQGIASEAGRITVALAFEKYAAESVFATILETNTTSQAVAERIGLRYSHHETPTQLLYHVERTVQVI